MKEIKERKGRFGARSPQYGPTYRSKSWSREVFCIPGRANDSSVSPYPSDQKEIVAIHNSARL